MEGNYEISSMPFSLKNICAAKVVHRVLLVNGIKSGHPSMTGSFEQETERRIRKLELPLALTEMLEMLLIPMQKELGDWYDELVRQYKHDKQIQCDAILTPQGTVDKIQSVKAILKMEPMDKFDRYILACEYCCEEQILEMFKELDLMKFDDACKMMRHSELAKFWCRAFQGQFGPVIHNKYLPINVFNEGFKIAMSKGKDVAIKHFIEKASIEEVRNIVGSDISLGDMLLYFPVFSPATYCLLFSKLSKDQQRNMISNFSVLLLKSFVQWPYHYFFADDAVQSLFSRLSACEYWFLMVRVVNKMHGGKIGYHYLKLFANLWKQGSCLRNSNFDYVNLVIAVLMTKSQQLINITFSEISTNTKDKLLMTFDENSIYFMLFANNYYEMFRMFVEVCCMNRKDVLLTFKSGFVAWIQGHNETNFCENNRCTRDEFAFRLKHFAELVDDIMANIRDADALDH